MREILFRAKSECDGEWVYGSLVHIDALDMIIPTDATWCGGTEFNMGYIVHPETVGQYTGLTDKDGKRIFEGDVIECWSEGVCARGEVQQRKDGMWIIFPAWQENIMWGICPDEYGNTAVRVIGNVHDNPELTEVQSYAER